MAKLHLMLGAGLTLCGKRVKPGGKEALGVDKAVLCGVCRRIRKGKV